MMEVISTRRYEARPPASSHPDIVYDPENSIATVKEEEWETRKKKEITTTRQIETRVKRQVVLEDGEIVVDSGPLVTTNTTEDVEQQEHTTQERRTTGDEPQAVEWPIGGKENDGVVQKELNETIVRSREEIEERLETEDRQQLGDISDEAYQKAIRTNRGDLRVALAESSKQLATQTGPRILQHTTRSNKVVDTENTLERSELKPDGLIVTETKKTVEHEETKDDELPEDDKKNGHLEDEPSETRKESSQRFLKIRDEDVVDYVSGGEKIAREMRYVSETTEGERIGDWPPPPTTMRTTRLHKHTSGFPADSSAPASRKDAITKKPLDLEEEDEARKFETSKWLESHFGSESRSSHGSIEAEDPPIQTGTNTSFINVTMKSCTPAREREYTSASTARNNQQRRNIRRESSSPSGYFHGISEWSERYQTGEKPNNNTRTGSPSHYVFETTNSNGYNKQESPRMQPELTRGQKESTYSRTYEATRRQPPQPEQEHRKTRHEHHQRDDPPSPPVRRRVREQIITRSEEKNSYNDIPIRTASPVLVVQRTWENRSKDVQQLSGVERAEARRYSPQNKTPPRSRSISPQQRIVSPMSRREKKIHTETMEKSPKSPSQSKYKIGESFRKLVGKLRSASSERKNKRPGSSSTSQLTQTDDDSTYRQYNVIDRNIPLVTEDDTEVKPPERPPRSPRNPTNSMIKTVKTSRSNGYSIHEPPIYHRNGTTTPVHRYYVSEDPYAVNNRESYSREKVYRETSSKTHGRTRGSSRNGVERDYSTESNSLGRFSKSTSRLTNEYPPGEDQFRSTQTLPRKLHSINHNNSRTSQLNSRRPPGGVSMNHVKQSQTSSLSTAGRANPSRQYGSMINISIKNAVTSQKPTTLTSNNIHQGPAKPERTYKSSLSRSKSFNIDANRNASENATPNVPYKSNLQLNRLNETPPLKSPGILASISRSNRDLFKEGKHEY